ncbi:MAG: hypothetical protein JSR86_10520 [Proteobacteria bacterium]|nr:hypothetical protein [Pseudomonadota bacterium]
MSKQTQASEDRFWILGGRWVDNARHLTWPRVYGPFADYATARASAEDLNDNGTTGARYLVVADVPDPTGSTAMPAADSTERSD